MKAAVVVPPIQDFYFTPHRLSALGARSLFPLLEKAGWEFDFFNFPLSKRRPKKIDLPDSLSYLQEFIIPNERGPVSFFSSYSHLGPSFYDCAGQIIKSEPDVILLSCFAFAYSEETLSIAQELRSKKTDTIITVGGGAVCADPMFFIRQDFENSVLFDFVFYGEAEISLPVFLEFFPRLTRQKPAYSFEIPNCFPNRTFFKEYPALKKTEAAIDYLNRHPTVYADSINLSYAISREDDSRITISTALSRGCPNHCRFCSVFLSHGRRFRKVPTQSLAGILYGLPKNKKLIINIEDDNMLSDTKYLLESLSLIKNIHTDTEFIAENGLDASLLHPELISTLISFGFRQFNLSLVSAADSVLETQQRPFMRKKFEACLDIINSSGIPSISYFICGLPDDNPEQTADTLRYLDRIQTRIGISLFYPVPGLPRPKKAFVGNRDDEQSAPADVYRCKGESPKLWAGSSAYPWSGSLSSRQLITAFRLARYLNFRSGSCSGSSINAREKELIETIEREKRIFTFVKEGKERQIIPVDNLDLAMVRAVLR